MSTLVLCRQCRITSSSRSSETRTVPQPRQGHKIVAQGARSCEELLSLLPRRWDAKEQLCFQIPAPPRLCDDNTPIGPGIRIPGEDTITGQVRVRKAAAREDWASENSPPCWQRCIRSVGLRANVLPQSRSSDHLFKAAVRPPQAYEPRAGSPRADGNRRPPVQGLAGSGWGL